MSAPLPPLQQRGFDDGYMLEPLNEEEIEPGSFDLVAPAPNSGVPRYSLEKRSEMLFSAEHLEMIFKDPSLLLRFTAFLGAHRPMSVAMLIYYLDAVKALRAIEYSNAVAEALDPIEGFDFTKRTPTPTENLELKLKIKESFDQLVREDLPAYITHVYIQTVSMTISRRIAGTLPIALRQASEGLAEVFCLSDPSRPDNPILFSSAEFHRTTQYGVDYVIGKNCRFLQGPKTNPFSVKRIRQKIDAGQEHCEVFLNYRRDGSPFMNLLMVAPLIDSNGVIRYFIGAQVDVSGLVKDCSDLESLQRLVDEDEITEQQKKKLQEEALPKDEFQELSDMLNLSELDIVRRWGGRMHKEVNVQTENTDPRSSENWSKPRLLINSGSPDGSKNSRGLSVSGQLRGIYENYLLVGRAPGLHIMFASPSLRVPGILLSPFMKKIGGSQRVRDELTQALADGQGVTAKLRWISKADVAGRSRWFHCTPLLAQSGKVGVWMVVLVDDEDSNPRYRQPPPVDPKFGRFGGASGISTEDGDDRSLISFALGGESRDGAASLRSHAST
ncbi:hypothetical protein BJ878DRAFT_429117 [Calycina marina]|uniref:PAC domain-containing protein n=1 Tax=Calycina marina TaxID=1763456 RepID=A0A9P7YVY7_9HELO|nr:hypothetical protein BJ878DRAFT_429117 [Calycina marina]